MVTNEGIIRVFGATVLNPIAALGGALFVQPNTTMVAPFLPRIAQEGLIVVFVLLLFTGMVSWCNKTASRMALNNYFSSKSVKQESDLGLVLITGGAGGIGGELAQVLLARGLDVVVVDVLPLQFTGPPCSGRLSYYRCDITDFQAFAKVVDKIHADVGQPSVVFANAGVVSGKSLLDSTPDELTKTFAVNNLALLFTIKLFLPALVERDHGHFFVTSSAMAYPSIPRLVDYSATKAATLAIYEGLQAELKHIYNAPSVRCSIICPALVRTKMFAGLSNPSNFLAPSISPREVACMMAETVLAGESRHIVCPPSLGDMSSFLRAMPSWMRVATQWLSADAASTLRREIL